MRSFLLVITVIPLLILLGHNLRPDADPLSTSTLGVCSEDTSPHSKYPICEVNCAAQKKRCLPRYMILGAAKCGTTSLHSWLSQHPQIQPNERKEINHFTYMVGKKLIDVRGQSRPQAILSYAKRLQWQADSDTRSVIDATPYYLVEKDTPERVRLTYPDDSDIKFLVVVCNPVRRAFAHWKMARFKSTGEPRTFKQAIMHEMSYRIKRANSSNPDAIKDDKFDYLHWGLYAEQLKRWHKYFPKDRFMMFQQDDIAGAKANQTMQAVTDFLGLEPFNFSPYLSRRYNVLLDSPRINITETRITEMTAEEKKMLQDFYKPYNQELYEYVGRDMGW